MCADLMSVNKPPFPTSGQGDRRVDEAQKEVLRIQKTPGVVPPGSQIIGPTAHAYQVHGALFVT